MTRPVHLIGVKTRCLNVAVHYLSSGLSLVKISHYIPILFNFLAFLPVWPSASFAEEIKIVK